MHILPRVGGKALHSGARSARLLVQLVGGCRIATTPGDGVALTSRKSRALIGLLAISPNMTLPREKICGLLWSEFEEDKARASLRQCLKSIRDEMPGDLADAVFSDRELIGLDRHRVDCDIAGLLDQASRRDFADPAFARQELHESLFEGFHDLDESLSATIAVYRESVRRRLSAEFLAAMRQEGDAALRESAAMAMLALDPAHEPAARIAMNARAAAGDRAGALKLYDEFRARLRRDYDASPEPETVAVHKAIRDKAPLAAVAGPTPEDDHLTLRLIEDDPAGPTTGFALFAATLRGMLARFRHWTVVAAPAGGGDAIARPFDYTLRLTAQPSPAGFRVVADLAEAATGATVWSQTLATGLAEAIANQEALLRGLCGALDVYVSENQIGKLRIREPQSLSALEKWVKGQHLLQLWQPEADTRAEQLFLEAVHAWPDHATLHANLADIYNSRHIVFPGVSRSTETERKAMRFARRAVALDPLDPHCHVTLGWSLALAGKHGQAVHSFLRGHELNPSDPSIAMSAAHGLAICDDMDQAIRLRHAAFACHPTPPWSFWGFDSNIRFLAGDFVGAVASADRSGEIKTNILGWKCAALGHLDDASANRTGDELVDRIVESWVGPERATAETTLRWFLQVFPFAREAQRRSLREGLAKAGLPV